jgi:hypothetical protein
VSSDERKKTLVDSIIYLLRRLIIIYNSDNYAEALTAYTLFGKLAAVLLWRAVLLAAYKKSMRY